MADVKVTGETRYFEDRDVWECRGYGGMGPDNPILVVVESPTEDEAKTAFIAEWNLRDDTSWTPEEFGWERNWG